MTSQSNEYTELKNKKTEESLGKQDIYTNYLETIKILDIFHREFYRVFERTPILQTTICLSLL